MRDGAAPSACHRALAAGILDQGCRAVGAGGVDVPADQLAGEPAFAAAQVEDRLRLMPKDGLYDSPVGGCLAAGDLIVVDRVYPVFGVGCPRP